MLLGAYDHSIDDKNRVTLPARFRASFQEGLVLTRGMYAKADWEQLVQSRLATLDPLSRESRLMQRFFFSGAAEVEPDKQGRVMVPQALVEAAGLTKDVVVAGVYDHLEIWDRATWRKHLEEVEGSAENVAERLATKRD